MSRILRAPLPAGAQGYGLGFCRDRQVDPARQRIHLLWQGYAHAVQPPAAFPHRDVVPPTPAVRRWPALQRPTTRITRPCSRSFATPADALAAPRIDMPGANAIAGSCRVPVPPPVPDTAPELGAIADRDGVVDLAWQRSAMIGLMAELHRSVQADFTPERDDAADQHVAAPVLGPRPARGATALRAGRHRQDRPQPAFPGSGQRAAPGTAAAPTD